MLIDTTIGSLRRRLPAEGLARLCEDYGLHPLHEDGETELRLTQKELAGYGWTPPSAQPVLEAGPC